MDAFLEALSTKNARTANGAITNSTSLNKCLDFFSIAGNHNENVESFEAAFGEDENSFLVSRLSWRSRSEKELYYCYEKIAVRETCNILKSI